jgi:hypothetical protein
MQEHTSFAGVRPLANNDRLSNAAPRAMNAQSLQNHPEFPYLTWDLSPTKKGLVAVAAARGGPINVAYEIHGHGPIHLVVCQTDSYPVRPLCAVVQFFNSLFNVRPLNLQSTFYPSCCFPRV